LFNEKFLTKTLCSKIRVPLFIRICVSWKANQL